MDSTQQKTFTGFIIAGLVIGLLAWRAYYGTWPVSWPGAFGTVSAHYAYSVCSSQALGGAFNYLRACQWSYTWHTRCEIAGIIAVILLVIGIAGHVRVARRAVGTGRHRVLPSDDWSSTRRLLTPRPFPG